MNQFLRDLGQGGLTRVEDYTSKIEYKIYSVNYSVNFQVEAKVLCIWMVPPYTMKDIITQIRWKCTLASDLSEAKRTTLVEAWKKVSFVVAGNSWLSYDGARVSVKGCLVNVAALVDKLWQMYHSNVRN